jgi:hypothetical protein
MDDTDNINSVYNNNNNNNNNDIMMEVDPMCVFVSGILLFSAGI